MAFLLRQFQCLQPSVSYSTTSRRLLRQSSKSLQFWQTRTRCLTTTRQLTAKKTQPILTRTSPTPKAAVTRAIPAAKVTKTIYKSYADTLNSRLSPTLLYQAPSPVVYMIGCYVSGTFCLAYGVYNFWANYLYPIANPPPWVPVAFGAVAIAMGAFGLFTLFGVYRLVRTITAIPTPSDGLRLKIDCTAILPGLRPRSVIVPYNHPILSSTFHTPPIKLSLAEQVELYKQQEVQREIERSRILTLPFRQASYWTYRGFRAAKKTWSKEGFIYMRVMGYNLAWKIDREAAWALEDGKAIDRLVRHV